ncbi:hypothetical protein DFH06DRAFT_1131253 [Mycena polygramma]|nr:hypothetical protein DFH06DRAFT_1131253 [Mycena polygramma]
MHTTGGSSKQQATGVGRAGQFWEEGKCCQAPANCRYNVGYITGPPNCNIRLMIDREFGPPSCCRSAVTVTLFNPTFTCRATGGWSGGCRLLLADGIVASATTSAPFQTAGIHSIFPGTLYARARKHPEARNFIHSVLSIQTHGRIGLSTHGCASTRHTPSSVDRYVSEPVGMPHAADEVVRTPLSTPRAHAADVPAATAAGYFEGVQEGIGWVNMLGGKQNIRRSKCK